MAQTVLLKRSSVAGNVPGSSDLALGEIAVNTADGAVYIKKGNNDIVAVADNDILHIDTTNSRIGIGTTSPNRNLHIIGQYTVENSTSPSGALLFIPSSDANRIYSRVSNASSSSRDLAFLVGSTEAMRIDSSNNLLVGATSYAGNSSSVTGSGLSDGYMWSSRSANAAAIFNRLSTDGEIALFRKNGSTVGSIGTRANLVTIGNGDTGILFNGTNDSIIPESISGVASRDAAIDLGHTSARFKDLYLSGNAYIGSSAYAQYFGNSSDTNTLIQFAGSDDIRFRAGGTEQMRINTTGVGIGTTSPSSKLDVQQATAGNIISAEFDNTDYTANNRNAIKIRQQVSSSGSYSAYLGSDKNTGNVFLSNDSITANHLVINTSGKVGIGTSSPSTALEIVDSTANAVLRLTRNDTVITTGNQIGAIEFAGADTNDAGVSAKIIAEAESAAGQTALAMYTGTPSTLSERLRIDKDGLVGIGTDNPDANLHISSATGTELHLQEETAGQAATLKLTNTQNSFVVGSDANPQIFFINTDGNQGAGLCIDTSNNVGIGTTSPASNLHIKTSVDNSVAQGLVVERSANSDRGYINYNGGAFQFRSTVGDPIVFGETDSEHLRIAPDGNVGIGTSSPGEKLQVDGNIRLGPAHTTRMGTDGTNAYFENFANGAVIFRTNNYTERMRIDSSGNFLVGTTSAGNSSAGFRAYAGGNGAFTIAGTTLSLNRLSSNGEILNFQKDTVNVGSIGVSSSDELFLGGTADTDAFIRMGYSTIAPATSTGTNRDASISFGASNNRFKDLHLSGTANVGGLNINSAYTFPTADGSANQVLKTDGSGNLTFATVSGASGGTSISDADGDTKIQVEESTDEDIIRFDIAGTQKMFLSSTQLGVTGDLAVSGNLNITGDINSTSVTNLDVTDKTITMANNSGSSTAADGAGIIIEGPSNNASLLWDHTNQYLEFNKEVFSPAGFVIGTTGTKVGKMYNSSGVMALEAYTTRQISFGNATNGEHVRIDDTGNVGIGTASPDAKLQISHNGGHTSGNVAIANSSLDLYNPLEANTDEKGSILTFSDNYFGGSSYSRTTRAAIKGGTDTVGNTADGFLAFYTDASGGNTMPERMRIDHDGKVGIGTASPSKPLHVQFSGDNGIRIESEDNHASLYVDSHTGYGQYIRFTEENNNKYWINSTGGNLVFRPAATGTAANQITFNATGSVGIGITSPASKLSANGTIRAEGFTTITGGGAGTEIRYDSSGGWGGILSYDRGNSAYKELRVEGSIIKFKESGTDVMTIDGNKVGIGTTAPASLLEVSASSNPEISITSTAGSTDNKLSFRATSHSQPIQTQIKSDDNGNFTADLVYLFKATGTGGALSEKARLKSNGDFSANGLSIGNGLGNTRSAIDAQGTYTSYYNTETSPRIQLGRDVGVSGGAGLAFGGNSSYALIGTNDTSGTNLYFKAASGVGAVTTDPDMVILSNGNVGIGITTPSAKLQVEEYGVDTTTTSTTATTQVAIHSFAAATFRSARFTVQVTNSTDSTYHTSELLLIHDGTTANITEFGEIHTGSAVEATFDSDVNSGNVRLLATPASTDTMAFKVVCHSITT